MITISILNSSNEGLKNDPGLLLETRHFRDPHRLLLSCKLAGKLGHFMGNAQKHKATVRTQERGHARDH